MSNPNALPWIEAGYRVFAEQGPEALKVEQLARQVGISKTSFYHHFADLEVFTEQLMAHHCARAVQLAEQAAACRSIDPDFLRLLATNRLDMLFQRQLRMRRDNLGFQLCYQRAHGAVEERILPAWAEALGIPGQLTPAREMFAVVTDVFYQRLTNANLTYAWVAGLLREIEAFIRHAMKSSGSIARPAGGQS